jgi:hypothetical protein
MSQLGADDGDGQPTCLRSSVPRASHAVARLAPAPSIGCVPSRSDYDLLVMNAHLPPGSSVTGTVVSHRPWDLELLLDDQVVKVTVDLRFIDDDVAVIGDQNRWPALGVRLSGRAQGTTPSGQLRVTLRRSDQT